jgi:Ca2+/H+ antiporter
MNSALALMLVFVVLGLTRQQWERQSSVAMVLAVVVYIAYAYYHG